MEKTSLLAPRSSPISVANKQDKQHYPITIDLVATELLSKLFLNLRSALLSQLHILRCAVFQMLLLLLRQFAYKPRGVTGPQLHLTQHLLAYLSRRNLLLLLHHRASSHHGIRADMAALLQHGAHADEREVVHLAGIQNRAVADRDVVSQLQGSVAVVALLGRGQHSTILHVRVLSDRDGVYITYAMSAFRLQEYL